MFTCIPHPSTATAHRAPTASSAFSFRRAFHSSAATEIAQEALLSGRGVAELVLEHGLMDADQLAKVLQPEVLANLRREPEPAPAVPVSVDA